jgi:hypothetical protein
MEQVSEGVNKGMLQFVCVRMGTRSKIYIYIYMCVCVCVCTDGYTLVNIYVCVCVCVSMFVLVCVVQTLVREQDTYSSSSSSFGCALEGSTTDSIRFYRTTNTLWEWLLQTG